MIIPDNARRRYSAGGRNNSGQGSLARYLRKRNKDARRIRQLRLRVTEAELVEEAEAEAILTVSELRDAS
jgi:hypothetical protein